ncbi:phytanoyl-CoA dioxygenase family protein [Amnibacterium sp. CER49]|uniref:phytanoyl-CoA dioxygenase family protein n=1 Tax=Amnibacterium sp. CER49 TaxID=3039161 RepID=UPI00244CDBCF|nr:phytanoyl-CoA dioxygenase family protein [Amnibacterium sp. CER49]MDH2443214.1 phytanoyl-CoA dioxygenase family protein [Amnibacterium sp. CER49]
MLSEATIDVDRYKREGYLVVPGVLDSSQLAQMRAEARRVLQTCAEDPERYAIRIEWEVDNVDESRRSQMQGVIRKLEPVSDLDQAFADLARDPAVTAAPEAIFGDSVELFEDKLNLKLPGGSPYPWHQDWSCCWRANTDELVTCFIYLDDADESNGCLQVVPGSHIGKPIHPFRQGSHFEVDPAYVPQDRVVPVPLKAGDMICFDSYLLHYSDYNRSDVPRMAIIYTYNPARLGKVNEHRFPDPGH